MLSSVSIVVEDNGPVEAAAIPAGRNGKRNGVPGESLLRLKNEVAEKDTAEEKPAQVPAGPRQAAADPEYPAVQFTD